MSNVTVKVNSGDVIFIAPHGHILDDTNTDVMTEAAAIQIGGDAIINRGWRRGAAAMMESLIANCNDIRHCQMAPLCHEFLTPIHQAINVRLNAGRRPIIVLMHGMSNAVQQQADGIDAVVGYGNGNPPRITCDLWQKDLFVDALVEQGLNVYEGAPGGKYSAHNTQNLAQALRSSHVPCIQIEIIAHRRSNESIAMNTGILIANAADRLAKSSGYTRTQPFNRYL